MAASISEQGNLQDANIQEPEYDNHDLLDNSFPSPSSPFIPPPTGQDKIDLIPRESKRKRMGSKADSSGAQSPAKFITAPITTDSDTQDWMDGVKQTSPGYAEKREADYLEADDDNWGPGEGKLAGRARPLSVPPSDSTLSDAPGNGMDSSPAPAARPKHMSIPANMNGSAHPGGMSYTPLLPTPPSAGEGAQTPTGPRGSNFQRYSTASLDFRTLPDSKRSSLMSTRPAPTSPAPSRRQSKRLSRSFISSFPAPIPRLPGQNNETKFVMRIRDFAYGRKDPRHKEDREMDLNVPPRPLSVAPGGFLGPVTPHESLLPKGEYSIARPSSQAAKQEESRRSGSFHAFFSKALFPNKEGGESPSMISKDTDVSDEPMDLPDGEPEDGSYDEPPLPFQPGVYRAMYSFEPEGGAEMELTGDQEIFCLGRGGGDGWLIAVRDGYPDDVTHALVPEGYIEFIRPFEGDEYSLAMGSLAVE